MFKKKFVYRFVKSVICLLILFSVQLTFSNGLTVFADAAPPPPPVGSDLFPPVENTDVRMVSEYVLLDVASNSDYPTWHIN
ncbi:MAG: hypothetical protein JXB38_15005, partial [Anaerolineales bacterium]|nr:hypothetical protein [Anaerolineales bacterium]